MRLKVVSILLTVIMIVTVVTGVSWATRPESQSAPKAIGLCVPPVVCVTVSVPVPVTIKATVRVTEIITLPPIVRTIIQPRTITLPPLQAPTRTVTAPTRTVTKPGLPGATKTATIVVNREVVRNGTAPPVTREVRTTMNGGTGQNATERVTVTPNKEVVRIPGTTKEVTRIQALGLSLLGLILLMGLCLFLLWLGFILGYKSADKENTNFLRALRDKIKRPGKHE